VLAMGFGRLDAIGRGQGVVAIDGDTPEAKLTLGLLGFRVDPDGWGGGGGIACSAAHHHPAVRPSAFRGGLLSVPHEVTTGTHAVGVDGFHQLIDVEMHVFLRR
jgi:hypothetical protein